LISKQRFLKES